MQCAACGAALPPGETMSCSQCGATLAIPSLRRGQCAVAGARAGAARRRRASVAGGRQAPPRGARRRPAAPARVGGRACRPRRERARPRRARRLGRASSARTRSRGRAIALVLWFVWHAGGDEALRDARAGHDRDAAARSARSRSGRRSPRSASPSRTCRRSCSPVWRSSSAACRRGRSRAGGACRRRRWLLGVYGLFGFHFLLFVALRNAPPLEANLVNYLWPLLIVVLAPVFLPGLTLRPVHVGAALAGFAGAALAIVGGRGSTGGFAWGYLAAAGSAFIWASYSLADATRRRTSRRRRSACSGWSRACWRSPATRSRAVASRCRRATGC